MRINDFWQAKYRKESGKSWEAFYRRNESRFFKDRHWVRREFPEMFESQSEYILEVGCGVGNTILPLSEEKYSQNTFLPNQSLIDDGAPLPVKSYLDVDPGCSNHAGDFRKEQETSKINLANDDSILESKKLFACDISKTAIDILKKDPRYSKFPIHAFVTDLTHPEALTSHIPKSIKFDAVSCIFVLSAIPPEKMRIFIENMASVMKPGGILVFRDYCRNDHAESRFKQDRKLDDGFYVRQDGTLSFFFETDHLIDLFCTPSPESNETLFACQQCTVVESQTVNIKETINVKRLFLQAKFIRF